MGPLWPSDSEVLPSPKSATAGNSASAALAQQLLLDVMDVMRESLQGATCRVGGRPGELAFGLGHSA